MASGNGIVYLAIIIAFLGMLVSYLHIWSRDDRLVNVARLITWGLLIMISGMMLFFYYVFMTSDMNYFYVWQYSTVDLEAKYKFSAVLAGLAGSLLFWVWWIIIPWAIEEWRSTRRKIDGDLLSWTRIFTFLALIVILYSTALYNPFESTPDDLLAGKPDGNGLNALLQTNLMVIHPPVIFIAYGVMVLPFAAALAYLLTEKREWTKLSIDWSRVGWLFLTAGIGIGGLWAYVVLGWGGYWAWDPIETSSLLPWLLLTAFLHTQLMYMRKGDYRLIAPLLASLSFILVVFATFSTRAAGLWVSVHSYGEADVSVSPWDRFTEIMDTIPSIRIYVWFMVLVTLVTFYLAYRIYARNKKEEEKEEDKYIDLEELISDDLLMFMTVILLVLTTVVTMLILVSGVNGLGPENFNGPVGLLAMVGILLLLVCLMWRDLGRKRVVMLAGVTLLVSLAGYFLFSENAEVAATMPILVVGMVGTSFKVVKSWNRKRLWPSVRLVSAHLIHLSVVLIIIGYVGSTYLQEERILNLEIDGPSQEQAGYDVKALGIDEGPDYVFVEMEVWKDGRLIGEGDPGAVYVQGTVRSEVSVIWTFWEDVYLIYGNHTTGSPQTANVAVTVLPLMNFLWAGMYLMMIGITIRLISDAMIKRRRGEVSTGDDDISDLEAELEAATAEEYEDLEEDEEYEEPEDDEEYEEPEEQEEKDDSYYEDLLERELKRI
ncbi:MAG: cytochrome c biogenesis protein CcsA [Thermoplasmata archaeon]|nr:cytochrome c biogenesis protein CcsA [Thermoplasmata archaeon]